MRLVPLRFLAGAAVVLEDMARYESLDLSYSSIPIRHRKSPASVGRRGSRRNADDNYYCGPENLDRTLPNCTAYSFAPREYQAPEKTPRRDALPPHQLLSRAHDLGQYLIRSRLCANITRQSSKRLGQLPKPKNQHILFPGR